MGALIRSLFLLATGSLQHCRVEGSSMEPTLYEGDLVLYKPLSQENKSLEQGSIVVFEHPIEAKTLLIKRVYKSSPKFIEVRGDNQSSSIDSRQFGVINSKLIRGVVKEVIPKINRKSIYL